MHSETADPDVELKGAYCYMISCRKRPARECWAATPQILSPNVRLRNGENVAHM